jgi:hypothetical protein
MDLVALEPVGDRWRIVFWEAKLVDDARARCRGDDVFPKVVEQLAQYTSWLRHADHRDLVAHAYHSEALEWCRAAGAEIAYIHTSGHASPTDLRAFAASLRPKFVVPIHGVKWDEESRGFGAVRRLADAETLTIP